MDYRRYNRMSVQRADSIESDPQVLTYTQATELIKVLDNTRTAIENYVHILEVDEGVRTKTKSWWGRNCFPEQRKTLYKHLFLLTTSLQLLNLLVVTIIDAWPRGDQGEHQFLIAGASTMIILQTLNLILCILVSGRLVKQIYKHSVNRLLLAQSYMATLLLFAGIYTTTYRLDKTSWKFIQEDLHEYPADVFVLYAKFAFYSISTATLCGADNVLPVDWYNCIFASIQMLLSFSYFGAILGIAVSSDVMNTSLPTTSDDVNNNRHSNSRRRHQHHPNSMEKHASSTNYFINQLTTPTVGQLPNGGSGIGGGVVSTGYWGPQVRPELPPPPQANLQTLSVSAARRSITSSSPDMITPHNPHSPAPSPGIPHMPHTVTPASILQGGHMLASQQHSDLIQRNMLVVETDMARERTLSIVGEIARHRAQTSYS